MASLDSPAQAGRDLRAVAIGVWGVGGVALLLLESIVRLLPRALEPWRDGFAAPEVTAAYLAAMVGLAYCEGYRGFQKRFAPRVIVRAMHLAQHPSTLHVALAPLMVMGLIHATRRRLVGSWVLVFGIVGLVVAITLLDQPWRGAIDAGVVVGLSWGLVSILAFAWAAARGQPPDCDPELPERT